MIIRFYYHLRKKEIKEEIDTLVEFLKAMSNDFQLKNIEEKCKKNGQMIHLKK